ncbi:hypothetical protein V2G26_018969 [Clonostachys chloroleuca]
MKRHREARYQNSSFILSQPFVIYFGYCSARGILGTFKHPSHLSKPANGIVWITTDLHPAPLPEARKRRWMLMPRSPQTQELVPQTHMDRSHGSAPSEYGGSCSAPHSSSGGCVTELWINKTLPLLP